MEIKESDMSNYELSNWEKVKNNNKNFFSNLTESNSDSFTTINESFYSLTGDKFDDNKLKHNNMDPFFIKKTHYHLLLIFLFFLNQLNNHQWFYLICLKRFFLS